MEAFKMKKIRLIDYNNSSLFFPVLLCVNDRLVIRKSITDAGKDRNQ